MRPPRKPISTSRPAHRRPVSAMVIMTIVFVVAAMVVMGAILFAPKKPDAPPASKISYEDRPEKGISVADNDSAFPPSQRPRPDKTQSVIPAAVEKTEGRFVIHGRVTEANTGKPIAGAVVSCLVPGSGKPETEPKKDQADERRERRRGRRGPPEPPRLKRAQGVTDDKGQYTIRVDVAGAYVFEVRAATFIDVKNQRGFLEEARGELVMDFTMSRGGSISGRVTEAGTSKPAPEVHLRTEGPERQETVTDANGAYTLGGLTPGDYNVIVDLAASRGYVVAGMVPSRNVTLKTELQEIRGIDFTVEIAGQVWGYVMTPENEPVSGTEVVLCTTSSVFSQFAEASLKKTPPASDRSKDDGYYELASVPLNKEWQLYAMTDERSPQLTAPFLLTATQRVARIDIFVSPGTTISGRVVGTDHKPIPGAEVICIPGYSKFFSAFDTPQAFRNQKSEEDGTFKLPHIPAGEYQILAQKKGYKFAAMGEPVYPNGFNDIHNVEVVLTPVTAGEASVYGTVTDGSGKPIDGVKLTLNSMSMEDMSPGETDTTTDPDGRYVFTGVQAGILVLRVEKTGYQGQNISNVKLDEPTDIVLPAASIIAGTVLVKETNAPPQQASIQAVRLAQSGGTAGVGFMMQDSFTRGSVAQDGRFEIQVGEGDYSVEARATGLTPARQTVSVAAGQRLDGVTLYMRQGQAGARIAGHVLLSDHSSPQGALVWLAQNSAEDALQGLGQDVEQRGIQAGEDGAYEFGSLAAGEYTVFAKLEPYAQAQSQPIQLNDGEVRSGVDLLIKPGNALEGYVFSNGRPEANAIVTVLVNRTPELGTTDASGYYRIERLPAGTYLASVISSAGNILAALSAPRISRVDIIDGQTATCNFGEQTPTAVAGICMPPPPAGSIGLAILHMPGTAPNLNMTNITSLLALLNGGALASSLEQTTGVAPDGSFRIDGINAGEYVLDIVYGGLMTEVRQVFSGPVTVTEGNVTQLNLEVGAL